MADGTSRRRLRLVSRYAAVVGVAAMLLSGLPAASAWADRPPAPSQQEVDQAKAAAKAKAKEVGNTQAQLAAANAALDRLNDQVEIAVERYNGAVVALQKAQQQADQAKEQLAAAQADTDRMRVKMGDFAASSYRSDGELGKLGVLLSSENPSSFLTRASTLSVISRKQGDILQEMRATQTAQDLAKRSADQALVAVHAAADEATNAKDAAQRAVDDQAQQITAIQGQVQQLQNQLAVLQGKAKDLEAARQAELKRQREEREAAERAARSRAAGGQPSSAGLPVPPGGHSISTSAGAAKAIAYARAQLGVWYRWSGAGEVGPTVTDHGVQNVIGFDCSGLTMMAWRAGGVSLSHYTQAQWGQGIHVSRNQLRPGDLVFFATNTSDPSTIHHVGLYIGNNQMIDAPRTGAQVRIEYAFRADYIGAVRP